MPLPREFSVAERYTYAGAPKKGAKGPLKYQVYRDNRDRLVSVVSREDHESQNLTAWLRTRPPPNRRAPSGSSRGLPPPGPDLGSVPEGEPFNGPGPDDNGGNQTDPEEPVDDAPGGDAGEEPPIEKAPSVAPSGTSSQRRTRDHVEKPPSRHSSHGGSRVPSQAPSRVPSEKMPSRPVSEAPALEHQEPPPAPSGTQSQAARPPSGGAPSRDPSRAAPHSTTRRSSKAPSAHMYPGATQETTARSEAAHSRMPSRSRPQSAIQPPVSVHGSIRSVRDPGYGGYEGMPSQFEEQDFGYQDGVSGPEGQTFGDPEASGDAQETEEAPKKKKKKKKPKDAKKDGKKKKSKKEQDLEETGQTDEQPPPAPGQGNDPYDGYDNTGGDPYQRYSAEGENPYHDNELRRTFSPGGPAVVSVLKELADGTIAPKTYSFRATKQSREPSRQPSAFGRAPTGPPSLQSAERYESSREREYPPAEGRLGPPGLSSHLRQPSVTFEQLPAGSRTRPQSFAPPPHGRSASVRPPSQDPRQRQASTHGQSGYPPPPGPDLTHERRGTSTAGGHRTHSGFLEPGPPTRGLSRHSQRSGGPTYPLEQARSRLPSQGPPTDDRYLGPHTASRGPSAGPPMTQAQEDQRLEQLMRDYHAQEAPSGKTGEAGSRQRTARSYDPGSGSYPPGYGSNEDGTRQDRHASESGRRHGRH